MKPCKGSTIGFELDPVVVAAWQRARPTGDARINVVDGSFLERVLDLSIDQAATFVFLDPPYLWRTRSDKRYPYDMTDEQHRGLLRWCDSVTSARVMLCGYPSELYDNALKDWRRVEYQAMTRGGYPKTEVIWMNYGKPSVLHDSRFVGCNFREREKLKRRRQTIYRKIERMEATERLALFDRLRERFPEEFNKQAEQ
jgi:hypothetical protein